MERKAGRQKHLFGDEYKDVGDIPPSSLSWRFTAAQEERVSNEAVNLALPLDYGGRLKDPVRHTGWLKAHDFSLLTSDIGNFAVRRTHAVYPRPYVYDVHLKFSRLRRCSGHAQH
jgi:hypothetical protein